MSTATMTRPPATPDRRDRLRAAVLVGAVVAALAAGAWGMAASRGHGHSAAVGDVVDVPGGQLRIDKVQPEILAHVMMPGMTMPDPLPDGHERFSVWVSLRGGPGGLDYAPGDFTVSGEGLAPTTPHRAEAGPGVVPEGMTATASLLFQVPKDAEGLVLRFKGGEAVSLGNPAIDGLVDDHDDHDHEHDH